jgi:hypothetical protein
MSFCYLNVNPDLKTDLDLLGMVSHTDQQLGVEAKESNSTFYTGTYFSAEV